MASTFKYRVHLEDGSDLDVTTAQTWGSRDTIYAVGLPVFRIVEVVSAGRHRRVRRPIKPTLSGGIALSPPDAVNDQDSTSQAA